MKLRQRSQLADPVNCSGAVIAFHNFFISSKGCRPLWSSIHLMESHQTKDIFLDEAEIFFSLPAEENFQRLFCELLETNTAKQLQEFLIPETMYYSIYLRIDQIELYLIGVSKIYKNEFHKCLPGNKRRKNSLLELDLHISRIGLCPFALQL